MVIYVKETKYERGILGLTSIFLFVCYLQVIASPTTYLLLSPSYQSRDLSVARKCVASHDSSFGEEIEYNGALFLCSVDDATSSIDYSNAVNIDDGVVNSPPSLGPLLTFAKSMSSFRRIL